MMMVAGIWKSATAFFYRKYLHSGSSFLHQLPKENVGIHIAQLTVVKTSRYGTDDPKTISFPDPNSRFIGTHHQIELHTTITEFPGCGHGMGTQCLTDTLPSGPGIYQISSIGNMAAVPRLVGFQDVCSQECTFLFGYKNGIIEVDPGSFDLRPGEGIIIRKVDLLIHNGFPELPNGIQIGLACRTNEM